LRFLFVFLFTFITLVAETIKFSPLPMDKSSKIFLQYSDMLKYLEKETGYSFEFVYASSYEELIDNFKDGKIDIIELGPLPFVKLKSVCKYAEPFLTFKSKEGKANYSCDILTTNKKIKNIKDIFNAKINKKMILTRKLSTCGYLMTEFVLNDYSLSLESLDYNFVGTHSNVLLELLLKENTIGTVKSTVANKYKHFNFNKIIQSPSIPGFAFIANKKKISDLQVQKIQKAILKLNPLENKDDKKTVMKWSENTKYGAIKTKKDAYKIVYKALQQVKIPVEDKL